MCPQRVARITARGFGHEAAAGRTPHACASPGLRARVGGWPQEEAAVRAILVSYAAGVRPREERDGMRDRGSEREAQGLRRVHAGRAIDPALVRPSKWGSRHESAYASPAFERLKDNIDLSNGNEQPILVRRVEEGFEILCGHRRHRACSDLGLPVFAVVFDEPLSALDLFLALERENREREDVSPYDQGRMYVHALDTGLFSSQRRLSVAIGVSNTWVRKAIQIARLPVAVIEAFLDPTAIQPAHAENIAVALAANEAAVMRRAAELSATKRTTKRSATQVVQRLVGGADALEETYVIRCGLRTLGHWRRDGKGRAVVTLVADVSDDTAMARVAAAIGHALSGGVET